MEMTRENAWGELRLFCKEIEKVTSSERSALQPLVNTDWRVVEGSMNLQPSLAGLIFFCSFPALASRRAGLLSFAPSALLHSVRPSLVPTADVKKA
jgi:hypothetical protein